VRPPFRKFLDPRASNTIRTLSTERFRYRAYDRTTPSHIFIRIAEKSPGKESPGKKKSRYTEKSLDKKDLAPEKSRLIKKV